jgi:hypothetical protein
LALARLLDRTGHFAGDLNPFQVRLLRYLIDREQGLQADIEIDRFKASLLVQSPEMYDKIYGEVAQEEATVVEARPASPSEVEDALADLKAFGLAP